jgi:hypothetical protein
LSRPAIIFYLNRIVDGLNSLANCQLLIASCLLHFLMPCVLAATLAELLELEPPRRRLLVLGGRVVPLFAIAAL